MLAIADAKSRLFVEIYHYPRVFYVFTYIDGTMKRRIFRIAIHTGWCRALNSNGFAVTVYINDFRKLLIGSGHMLFHCLSGK